MKINTSNSSLLALFSLFLLGSSLPIAPLKALPEPLVPRATYSVVPVDGGQAAATGDDSGAAPTVFETIIETSAPKTTTLTTTDIPPTVTDYIVSTKTIEGDDTTETVLVTIPVLTTATTIEYSVVGVEPAATSSAAAAPSIPASAPPALSAPTSAPAPPAPVVTPSTLSTTSPTASTSSTLSSTSSSTISSTMSTILPSSTSTSFISSNSTSTSTSTAVPTSFDDGKWAPASTSSATYTSSFITSSISSAISMTTSSPLPETTSSRSYDDGQWHTTYPSWSNTTWTQTAALNMAQTTSLV